MEERISNEKSSNNKSTSVSQYHTECQYLSNISFNCTMKNPATADEICKEHYDVREYINIIYN